MNLTGSYIFSNLMLVASRLLDVISKSVFNVQKGRANKTEYIWIGTRGNEEMGNMKKILDVAIERGCPEVDLILIYPFDDSL